MNGIMTRRSRKEVSYRLSPSSFFYQRMEEEMKENNDKKRRGLDQGIGIHSSLGKGSSDFDGFSIRRS